MKSTAPGFSATIFFAVSVVGVGLGCTDRAAGPSDASTSTGPDADAAGAEPDADAPDPRPALLARLATAEAAWSTTKTVCPTYHYVRSYTSFVFIGSTTVQVVEGTPSWRRYWRSNGAAWPNPEWTEGSGDIGSHFTYAGVDAPDSPGIDIEQLHAECREILSGDPSIFAFALEMDAQGVPVYCFRGRRNCSDDCASGIQLVQFACGSQDPCLGAGCPGSGPYDYNCWRNARCDTTQICAPLPDGTSCGAGTCSQAICR